MTRLPHPPPRYEAEFQSQVQDLASLYGWRWMHIRPAMNQLGHWRTPISGELGAGWPDLTLARDSRLIFAELKLDREKPTGLQTDVLTVLANTCAEVYVWRPADWSTIMELLR